MGGANVHGQLHLQRYSIQRSLVFRKYYKSLFLGLVDLAIVNSYVVHKEHHAAAGAQSLSHVHFLRQVHIILVQLQDDDKTAANTFGSGELSRLYLLSIDWV